MFRLSVRDYFCCYFIFFNKHYTLLNKYSDFPAHVVCDSDQAGGFISYQGSSPVSLFTW